MFANESILELIVAMDNPSVTNIKMNGRIEVIALKNDAFVSPKLENVRVKMINMEHAAAA